MKKTLRFKLTFVAAALLGCESPPPPSPTSMVDAMTFLAADAREGRGVGTTGLADAAEYLAERFAEVGLAAPEGGYLRPFRIDSTAPAAAHAGLGGANVANIVGIQPGSGTLVNEVVVVGAHYDHLGLGGDGSLEPNLEGTVHNGADDNASGTVAMLEIAHRTGQRASTDARTIVFVAFTAEELGLIGSTQYVTDPVRSNESTFAMINLDMVGRMQKNKLAAFGAETAEEFTALLDSVNTAHGLDVTASGDGFGRSDHQSFFVKDIPVLHFFTGTHEDYHATGDDADRINFDGLSRVASYVSDVAWALATRTAPLTFVDAEEPVVVAGTGERPYLGTIPDMTSSPGGVRVSGVTPGSPADRAGMQAGDVLIGIGEHGVGDLYDMTNALNAHSPDDTVTLQVRREGQVLELTAVLGRRSE